MIKSPVALIAALLAAVTMFASSAEAGLKIRLGFGGPLPSFTAHGGNYHSGRHYHRKRYLARRVKKEKVYVAKRKAAEPKVAKAPTKKPATVAKAVPAAPAVEPEVIADSENSSISTAALEEPAVAPVAAKTDEAAVVVPAKAVAETTVPQPEQKPAKAASKLDCKKFFPSVGMTLTVPCE